MQCIENGITQAQLALCDMLDEPVIEFIVKAGMPEEIGASKVIIEVKK